MKTVAIGTASWSIPKEYQARFPTGKSHLERYAQVFDGVEINSSFYREHKAATYARWAESTPEAFRFSVKLSKRFTHIQRLSVEKTELQCSLQAIAQLGEKWGCLLIQLPPSLKFEAKVAAPFFKTLRAMYEGPVAFEPRHASWESEEALAELRRHELATVIADPQPYLSHEVEPMNLLYLRLHGSPEIYRSAYEESFLLAASAKIQAHQRAFEDSMSWCIFDNTTFGHATGDALRVQETLSTHSQSSPQLRRHVHNEASP